MVDNSELKFIAKVIRNKSRFSCHQRSFSLVQDNAPHPLKIQIVEPIHKSIEFSSPSSSSNDLVPINIPSHHNFSLNNTYPSSRSNHPRRSKTHPLTSHSVDTFFEIKYHYLSLNPYFPLKNDEYEDIPEHLQHGRPRFGVCGKEWSTKKSVAQLIFYWETVFIIGVKAARKYAGWGRTF